MIKLYDVAYLLTRAADHITAEVVFGVKRFRNIKEGLSKIFEGLFQFAAADRLQQESAAVKLMGLKGILLIAGDEYDVDRRPAGYQSAGLR